MKNFIRPKESRRVKPARPAVAALALAAAVAGAAGIVAGRGNAAPPGKADEASASHLRQEPMFKQPQLKHGLLKVVGTRASDKIVLRLQAGEPGILQVDVGDDGSADFTFERKDIGKIAVDARAGDDLVRIDEANGVFTDSIPTTIDGGDGNDNLAGGSGAEKLLGADGDDSIDGNKGNDLALMGAGDDTFVWDPGDGSDTVEGRAGADTMRFNGALAGERVDLSANGSRLRFFRDVGNITMDTDGVERVDFNALGGSDQVTVNDLSGTDVGRVNVDLAGTLGGAAGDGQADRVIVNGTNGNDTINVSGDASGVAVSGLPVLVAIQHQDANDGLGVNGLGGNDSISAAALAAQAIVLALDGGTGDDTLAGGQGVETLLGGDGDDSIDGNKGNDLALMGAGDDTFVWDPGDGSDTVEGQDGADTMRFNGAPAGERVDLSSNGGRLRFFRDVGNITMDTDGVERVDFNALGGSDQVTVNDLSGTDVSRLNVDLAGALGGAAGDGQPDRVIVNGTNGKDAVAVAGRNGSASVSGLAVRVNVTNADPASDTLEINTLDGNDVVQAFGLAASAVKLQAEGGNGNDILIGGAGDDTLFGEAGDDLLIGGPGQDALDGGPGNNILIQA